MMEPVAYLREAGFRSLAEGCHTSAMPNAVDEYDIPVIRLSDAEARIREARDKALEEAANEIKKLAAAMGRIADHPEASQKKAQAAIDMLEVAETVVRALKEKP